IRSTDHLVHRPETESRHDLAHLFGDKEEKVHNVLGLAGETSAKLRILRRDPDRTGVEMTLAHHHATLDDERRSGESKLVGAKQRGDGYIATGLELPVGLQTHSSAQAIHHEGLLCLGKTQ